MDKESLVTLFNSKYPVEVLEKSFSFFGYLFEQGAEKRKRRQPDKEKWILNDCLQFLKEKLGSSAKIKNNLEAEDLEAIIDYYQSSPTLWNHNQTFCRDCELRELVGEFDGKYINEEIKQEWHNLVMTQTRSQEFQRAGDLSEKFLKSFLKVFLICATMAGLEKKIVEALKTHFCCSLKVNINEIECCVINVKVRRGRNSTPLLPNWTRRALHTSRLIEETEFFNISVIYQKYYKFYPLSSSIYIQY